MQKTKEQKRKSWETSIGLSQMDGAKPSQEFLNLVEQEINGEITREELRKATLTKWQQ